MAPKNKTVQAVLDKLTPQRRKFVLAFCDTFNATKAALAAGYSKKTARTYGSQLLTFLDIKLGIRAVLDTAGMDPEEIAARWDRIARLDLSDFYTKQEYEESTTMPRPLAEQIAQIEKTIDFDVEFAVRAVDILGLLDEEKEDYLDKSQRAINKKRLRLLELQMELERNPEATYDVPGPPIKKHRMVLDLVKAHDLGVLDLLKSTSDGRNGPGITVRDPDAALDNLAKWRGMLTTKIDLTSKGESVAPPPVVGVLSAEQARAILEARRQQREKGAAAGE